MSVVPFYPLKLDTWNEEMWEKVVEEKTCPWHEDYRFASTCEWGSFIHVRESALAERDVPCLRVNMGMAKRRAACPKFVLTFKNITSTPRVWFGSFKNELLTCGNSNEFLDVYPLSGIHGAEAGRPRLVSYCCVRGFLGGAHFFRVLCVACRSVNGPFVHAVVHVTANKVRIRGRTDSGPLVHATVLTANNAQNDFVSMDRSVDVQMWHEVEDAAERIRDAIGFELAGENRFVRMRYVSTFSDCATREQPQTLTFGSPMTGTFRRHNGGGFQRGFKTHGHEVRTLLRRGTF